MSRDSPNFMCDIFPRVIRCREFHYIPIPLTAGLGCHSIFNIAMVQCLNIITLTKP